MEKTGSNAVGKVGVGTAAAGLEGSDGFGWHRSRARSPGDSPRRERPTGGMALIRRQGKGGLSLRRHDPDQVPRVGGCKRPPLSRSTSGSPNAAPTMGPREVCAKRKVLMAAFRLRRLLGQLRSRAEVRSGRRHETLAQEAQEEQAPMDEQLGGIR